MYIPITMILLHTKK